MSPMPDPERVVPDYQKPSELRNRPSLLDRVFWFAVIAALLLAYGLMGIGLMILRRDFNRALGP
jgi:hypothetical protein